MSLMDKSVSFNSTNPGLAAAIYNVIKPIFTDAILDINVVYIDSNKKDGLKIVKNNGLALTYIIQNKEYTYRYTGFDIGSYSTLYYNISAKKDMIAFGFRADPGTLDFGIGYEEKIGFWGFMMGARDWNGVSSSTQLFIKDNVLYKQGTTSSSALKSRWYTSNTDFNLSLIQLPLFVTSGNFNSLFEVISCNTAYSFNKNTVIFSNNKYYRLLQPYNSTAARDDFTILAMEVADD